MAGGRERFEVTRDTFAGYVPYGGWAIPVTGASMPNVQNTQGGAAKAPPIPSMDVSPPPPATAREIRQQVRDMAKQARVAAQDAKKAAGPAESRAEPAQDAGHTATTVTPSPAFDPSDMIPPQAVDMSYAFFLTVAVCVVGFPIARALGRRIDRKTDFKSVAGSRPHAADPPAAGLGGRDGDRARADLRGTAVHGETARRAVRRRPAAVAAGRGPRAVGAVERGEHGDGALSQARRTERREAIRGGELRGRVVGEFVQVRSAPALIARSMSARTFASSTRERGARAAPARPTATSMRARSRRRARDGANAPPEDSRARRTASHFASAARARNSKAASGSAAAHAQRMGHLAELAGRFADAPAAISSQCPADRYDAGEARHDRDEAWSRRAHECHPRAWCSGIGPLGAVYPGRYPRTCILS